MPGSQKTSYAGDCVLYGDPQQQKSLISGRLKRLQAEKQQQKREENLTFISQPESKVRRLEQKLPNSAQVRGTGGSSSESVDTPSAIKGLLSSLAKSTVQNESDAAMAYKISNALTQSLLQYRLQKANQSLAIDETAVDLQPFTGGSAGDPKAWRRSILDEHEHHTGRHEAANTSIYGGDELQQPLYYVSQASSVLKREDPWADRASKSIIAGGFNQLQQQQVSHGSASVYHTQAGHASGVRQSSHSLSEMYGSSPILNVVDHSETHGPQKFDYYGRQEYEPHLSVASSQHGPAITGQSSTSAMKPPVKKLGSGYY